MNINRKNLKQGWIKSEFKQLLSFLATAHQRKERDILEFFMKAGENAIKAISGLIPGGKPKSQMATQPKGPKIPLNTINEDSIKPVIPYKRDGIVKLRNNNLKKETIT